MATQERMWLMQILQALDQSFDYTIKLYCGNQSTIKITENPIFHAKTKHMEVHYHFIKRKIKVVQGHIKMKYIKIENQFVDICTKRLSGLQFEEFKR